MPTATRTVVFTDLANYTASVARSDREGLRDLIRYHEHLVVPVIEAHHGRVVKNIGDSFMALFDAATDALRAGLDLVARARADGKAIRVSAATGDVEEIDGDAFGDAVNLAARINSRTPAEEVWFSEGTFHCMNQSEIPWDRVGIFTLKGIAGEASVFRAVPPERSWLPEHVGNAAREHALVVLRPDQPVPQLPPDVVVLAVGFEPGSPALTAAVDALPVLDPASVYLAAYPIAPSDRIAWESQGHGLVIGTPVAVETAILEHQRVITQDGGSNTIILDTGFNAALRIIYAGLALPSVPMSDVVGGYFYDLVEYGQWVNSSDQSLARIDVSPAGVSLVATSTRVVLDERPLRLKERVDLQEGARIRVGDRLHVFWASPAEPYLGFLLAESPTNIMVAEGQRAMLGREPAHPGLSLPDRRGQANIRWCAGPRAARARESGFTLDRALAGRHQVSITPSNGVCAIEPLHERCPTWAWTSGGTLERISQPTSIPIGDHIIVGTTVIALQRPAR
ncbi:MAG: adenylate/guanylate cyclase domain-containing protein [Pseudomonadota bacterium]